jgi:vancomycin resistance protein VanJ
MIAGYPFRMSVPVSAGDRSGRRRRRGTAVGVILAAAVGVVLVAHRAVPGSAGSALDSALPWLGALIPVLVVAAVVRRSAVVLTAAVASTLVWAGSFGPVLVDRSGPGPHDLRVAGLNIGTATPRTALAPLVAAGADIVVIEEITAANRDAITTELSARYPSYDIAGTVGLFSRLPLTEVQPVDIGIGWTRAVRATVTAPGGALRVYAAHLASARLSMTAGRDRTITALAAALAADPSPRLLLAGDLNTTTTDRRFAAFAALHDTQQEAGAGFGFTWPASLPVLRPDHVLQRGMTTRRAWVTSAPGSDHRAVLADLDTTTPATNVRVGPAAMRWRG